MKKTTFEKAKNIILRHTSLDDLKKNLKNNTPLKLVQDGFFAVYHSDAYDELASIYEDGFDASRYMTKSNEWKYKNGQAYVWTIYCWIISKAIEKMVK